MSQPPETPPSQPPSETTSKPSPSPQIQQPNPSPSIPSSPSTPQSPSLNPNPNPPQYTRPPVTSPATQQQHLPQSLGRPPPPAYSRPWQQQQQHSYTHFSSTSSPLVSSSSAPASSSSSSPVTPQQRGGMAIGVPASSVPSPSPSPSQPPPPSSFPGSFGQQYGGLGRGTVGMSDATSVPQVRMMQGTQGIGMMGTLGSGTQMRPSGMAQHQQRPTQSSLRPASSPTSQAPVPQVCVFHSSCD